jgi:hypothetical protein
MTEARRKPPKKSTRKPSARAEEAPAGHRGAPARTEERRAPSAPADEARQTEEAELALGRTLALWIPALTVAIAGLVGAIFSAGPAILVLGVGALLGGIAFFWGSVRSLSGEAPLSPHILAAAPHSLGATDAAAEEKRRVLRSLKDLETERNLGKIGEEDYLELSATYRARAKQILREMDETVAPYRSEAERMAAKYLSSRGLAPAAAAAEKPAPEASASAGPAATAKDRRVMCPKCETANDSDAAFCKKCGTKLSSPDGVVDTVVAADDAADSGRDAVEGDGPRGEEDA